MNMNAINPYESRPWTKNYDANIPANLDFPEVPIHAFLDEAARDFKGRTAIYFQKNKISYGEFAKITDRLAVALANMGLKKGHVVAILIPSFPQFLFSYYGVLKAGGIVTACSVLLMEHELEFQLNDSGAEIIIAWDQQLEKVNNIKDRTALRHVIITSVFDYMQMGNKSPPEIAGTVQFLNLIENTKGVPPKVLWNPKEDIAVLQYTGGTTGLPKGAMLSHYNIVSNSIAVGKLISPVIKRGKDAALTNLPLFHIYGQTVCMNVPVHMAATIGLNPDPRDHKSLFELIRDIRPAMFPGVPTIYIRLLERDDIEDYAKDLRAIKVCNTGAAAMPPEVLKEFEERTGAIILEGYGLTEASPVTHSNPVNIQKRKVGSVGFPIPNTDVKIVDIDDDTKIMPVGESGEIIIKGPQVMRGYWNKPEETENQLKDGWLKTGDIGRMDEDGYFFIVDRKKDMINVSGFKVYPREVEDVLFEHEAVQNAAVIGIPHPKIYGNDIVKAYLILKDGFQESDDLKKEILEFCRKTMAPYKVPKEIDFRKELPETLVGKVLRKDLREREMGEEV